MVRHPSLALVCRTIGGDLGIPGHGTRRLVRHCLSSHLQVPSSGPGRAEAVLPCCGTRRGYGRIFTMGVYSHTSRQLPYQYSAKCALFAHCRYQPSGKRVEPAGSMCDCVSGEVQRRLIWKTMKALSSLPDAVLRDETKSHGSLCLFCVNIFLP